VATSSELAQKLLTETSEQPPHCKRRPCFPPIIGHRDILVFVLVEDLGGTSDGKCEVRHRYIRRPAAAAWAPLQSTQACNALWLQLKEPSYLLWPIQ
jgi:hypothetical protein